MAASTLTVRIFTERILPHLGPSETSVLSRVCKPAREVIEGAAKKPHKVVDFKKPNATWTPNTISSLIAYKWMMEIFTRRPEFLGNSRNDKEIPTIAKLSFDYKEGKIKEDHLQKDLSTASWEGDSELLKTVFFHPNAKTISAYDFYYNADRAILDENPAILRMILSFPGAAKIPANPYLGRLLWRAVGKNSIEMVKLVLAHPNAKDIQAGGVEGLAIALEIALENHDLAIAALIAAHPNANDISANGEASISRILFVILARKMATLKEVRFVLSLPQANDIAPKGGSHPLGILLKLAVDTGNLEIVQEILAHCNVDVMHIPSDGYGSIGASMQKANSLNFPDIFVKLARYYKGEWSESWVCIVLKNAIEANSPDLVERILKLQGIDAFPSEDYFKYFHLAVQQRRTIIALKFLNCKEAMLRDCLKQIVIADSAACMKFFLDSSVADALPLEGDYSLKAILQEAASGERAKLVKMILDSNRIPRKQLPAMVRHAFETAMHKGNKKVVKKLLSHTEVYQALSMEEINKARAFSYN